MRRTGNRRSVALHRFTAAELASPQRVPVMVEFAEPPVAVYQAEHSGASGGELKAYADRLRDRHQKWLHRLVQAGVEAEIARTRAVVMGPAGMQELTAAHDFVHLFNGMGLLLPGTAVPAVAQEEGIRAITLDQPRLLLNLNHSVGHVQAPTVWRRRDPKGRPVRGEGVVIAVIDTGIDPTHPAFGGYQQVPNPKVIHAASYTGEAPQDNFGHGTHVAGICAGDRFKETPRGPSRIRGVAPGAQLMNYKVLNAQGFGTAGSIVLAIEDAVRRGAHVINLSLGDASGDPDSPEAVAANNAMKAGTVVCCAAGNEGPAPGTVGTPGAAEQVITVGAATDPGVTALFARIEPEGDPARAVEVRPMAGSVSLPEPGLRTAYVDCGLGAADEAFPAAVQGRVALVRRGEVTFKEKARRAERAGALAVLIDNNEPGHFFGTLGEETEANPHPAIPVLSLSMEDGQFLRGLLSSEGVSRELLFLDPVPVPQPDRLAEFSSRGPTRDGRTKPDLCGPGVDVESATITPEMAPDLPGVVSMADPSGYTSVSGTSMATPHVAGACALLRQLYPQRDSATLKAMLVGSARYMAGQGGLNEQGAGMLDVSRAARTRHVLTTAGDGLSTAHHFGRVVHQGQRVERTQAFQVRDLGAGGCPCRLQVRWLNRAPGLRAYLSRRGFLLPTGGSGDVTLTLRIDGRKVASGTYYGLLEASRGGLVMRLPFSITVLAQPEEALPAPGRGEAAFPDWPAASSGSRAGSRRRPVPDGRSQL